MKLVLDRDFFMKKDIYKFEDVYYCDLDKPYDEIKRFENFLYSKDDIYYLSIKKQDKKIVDIECEKNLSSIEKYLFVESKLAGVGIDYFIIRSEDYKVCDSLKIFFYQMDLKQYYQDDWIEDIFDLNISTLYKTDCDGNRLVIYKK